MKRNASALKRERQNQTCRERNRVIKSKVHTAKKRLVEALDGKKRDEVETRFRTFTSEIDIAVKRNVFHKNKGARLKSRMASHIKTVFNEHKAAV